MTKPQVIRLVVLSGSALSRGGKVIQLGAHRLVALPALRGPPLRRLSASGSPWIDSPKGKNASLRTALWHLRGRGCAVVDVSRNQLALAAARQPLCVAHAASGGFSEATGAGLPPRVRPGASLANGRGVPGTLGAFAVRWSDGAPVLLTNHHVLFGGGTAAGEPVWLTPSLRRVGSSLYGKLGSVTHDGRAHHVDCAVASIDAELGDWRIDEQPLPGVRPGEAVRLDRKGRSVHGIVVDVRDFNGAPRQILVRSLAAGEPFSAEGDSGALLRNEGGTAVGLVWGATPAGETIASPLGPVLDVLGIRLLRPRA